jgi:hypothetical protein
MPYRLAHALFEVAKWFWLSVIVAFFITYVGNIAPLDRASFVKSFSSTVLGYFFSPLFHLIITLSTTLLLLIVTFIAWIIISRHKEVEEASQHSASAKVVTNVSRNNRGIQVGESGSSVIIQGDIHAPFTIMHTPSSSPDAPSSDEQLIQHYCQDIISRNTNIIPTGIATAASQALLSVSIPLDEVFIHLEAVSDRPIFDFTVERQKIQQEITLLQHRQDLSQQEKEDYIQSLKAALWQSEIGRGVLITGTNREVTIETVLQHLTPQSPSAVILGDPGAGKSTTVRWLTLHMARAYCSEETLSPALAPAQIPILIRIDDYAKYLSDHARQSVNMPGQELSFKTFFEGRLARIESELPSAIKRAISAGRCLLLFDGLDEVATDEMRLRVRDDIYDFMLACFTKQQQNKAIFNRFLITSRIVGYEPGALTQYAEYTLHELNNQQIEQFLASWCPAVERYQSGKEARILTAQDELRFQEDGNRQKQTLWRALQDNPGIRRMAVNPLMLTILALIQKSGGRLPHRRIELYECITQTLLDNWNQTRGGHRLAREDIQVAEEVLGVLAYERHSRDLLLTKKRVMEIARNAIAACRGRSVDEISLIYVEGFIETLSQSSSLFGQKGQGLFDFIHRTFEEYYAAMYLLNKRYNSSKDLEAFVSREYCHALWHEPILLAVASLNGQKDLDLQIQAKDLIKAILQAQDENDALLQRNLLLATLCVIDCEAFRVPATLQRELIQRLLDTYGDVLGSGRYTALQREIERITLLWLRGQSEIEEHAPMPVLLEAWRAALCDSGNVQRQEGAAHLVASLAPDLGSCPKSVLLALVPPLLQLADVLDIPGIPSSMRQLLPQPAAQPATLNVAEYAFIALRLLDDAGPAGWLHAQWLIWNHENPTLLKLLTQHSLELDYLLTPAAFPQSRNDPNWEKQETITKEWKRDAQLNPLALQKQLLQASTTARYPHAFLLWQLLTNEEQQHAKGTSWRVAWGTFLQQEMQHGRLSTYQTCLDLRSLLWRNDRQSQQIIADTLITDLLAVDNRSVQSLISLSNTYMIDLRRMIDLRNLLDLRYMIDLNYMMDLRDMIDMRDLRELRDLRGLKDLRYMLDLRYMKCMRYMRYMIDVVDMVDRDKLSVFLCSQVIQQKSHRSVALFILCSVVSNYDQLPEEVVKSLQQGFSTLLQEPSLVSEERLLIKAIQQIAGIEPPQPSPIIPQTQKLPEARAIALNNFKKRQTLGSPEVQEIIAACMDTRKLAVDISKELTRNTREVTSTVGTIAWQLFQQSWSMTPETWKSVVSSLQNEHALVCAVAAQLLQLGKDVPSPERLEAMAHIRTILADETLSRRPLDAPDGEILRLDDLLYDVLSTLAER